MTDAWLLSGYINTMPESAGREFARIVTESLMGHPELLCRNPALIERGWKTQAEFRADLIEQVGADLVVLPPEDAQETMIEHYRRERERAIARNDAETSRRAVETSPAPEQWASCPRNYSGPTASR